MEKLIEKYQNILRGEVTQNNARAFGDVHVQWRSLACHFAEKEKNGETPYRLTNVNSCGGKLIRCRIDYIRDGSYRYEFGTDGLTAGGANNWITLYFAFHGTSKEKQNTPTWIKNLQKELSPSEIGEVMNNLTYHGWTSRNIIVAAKKGKKINEEKIEDMKRASRRHSLTDYDEVDKRGMTDYEVRELRREMSTR